MALIYTFVTERGVVFPDQYCRVMEARVEKERMQYTVGVYFNKAATENPPHRAESFEAPFSLISNQNVWQQAYADLKTQWTDTVDA